MVSQAGCRQQVLKYLDFFSKMIIYSTLSCNNKQFKRFALASEHHSEFRPLMGFPKILNCNLYPSFV